MKLTDYLSLQVKPRRIKTISLSAKYPEASFVFEYADGQAARIDGYDGCSKKGEETLLQCLTGATNPTEEDGNVNSFNECLLPDEDLKVIQRKNEDIVRAWVLEW